MNANPNFSEQEFDQEIRELFKDSKPETVSNDFTAKVMNQIKGEKVAEKYQPVISSRTLFIIALFITVLVIWAVIQPGNSSELPWTLSSFSSSPFNDLLNSWQHTFSSISFQGFFSTGIFLPLFGLLFVLGIHYIFLAVFSNRSNKKIDQLYCF